MLAFTAVKNVLLAGGGAWNHALYFKHLAPATSPNADPSKSISKELSAAIDSSFGSLAKMQEEVTTAATKVFGSGWAWVCFTGKHGYGHVCLCVLAGAVFGSG